MYGKIKHTIRKLIEGATYINEDHGMNVSKEEVEQQHKQANGPRVTPP